MSVGFSEALLLLGRMLRWPPPALSGWLRASVLSVSVLAVVAGLFLAGVDVVSVDSRSEVVKHSIELALIMTCSPTACWSSASCSPGTGGRRPAR